MPGPNRFAKIPEALLYSDLSDLAVRVYGCLIRHGTTPETCHPTHARIAELIGKAERSIQRPVTELERAGWIERRTENEGGLQKLLGYVVAGALSSAVDGRAEERGAPALRSAVGKRAMNESKNEGAAQESAPDAETLFEVEPVDWRPTPARIQKAMASFGLDEDAIERTICAVNLEDLPNAKASKRWADLVRWASQDNWRSQRPATGSGARSATRPPEPVPVPAYVPEERPDALSAGDLAERVADLRRRPE